MCGAITVAAGGWSFKAEKLRPEHGIVVVECGAGTRVELPAELPLTAREVPVAYLDASDFLNVVKQLRSFKDVERYLAVRARLGPDVRRHVGDEQVMLEHYLLKGGTFEGWPGYDVARRLAHDERAARDAVFQEKQWGRADVSLVGRRQIGTALRETDADAQKSSCVYRALYLDELPEFSVVAVSTSGLPRQDVVNRTFMLLRGALAHFGWRDGLAIVDFDGVSFDIVLLRGYTPTDKDAAVGRHLFCAPPH